MGEVSFENALCDLEVGELKPTNGTLQLVTVLSSIMNFRGCSDQGTFTHIK